MDGEHQHTAWEALSSEVGQELAAWRAAHPRATLAEIEQVVLAAVGRLLAQALSELAHASAAADLGASPAKARPRCPSCGGGLEPRGQHEREVLTPRQAAPVRLRRSYGVCAACGDGVFPPDDELELLAGGLSAGLAEGLVRLGTWMPFAQAAEHLGFFWGVHLSEATVRRHTEAAGAAYVAEQTAAVERLERELPAAPQGPQVQQVSADGAMIPLVGGRWTEAKTLAIGTVEADDAAGAHATERSYFSRRADHETFTRLATVELHRRGTETAGVVVGVMDGADWLQRFLDHHRPDAVRVLDFAQAVEHLASAAQAALGPGTAATDTWLEARAHALKHGDLKTVLTALRALPVGAAADPAAAAAARDRTLGYLEKRREQLRSAEFLAAGYPIGSGTVESANKLVVEARLKGSGMHWAPAHVDPLLALRTIACAGRWAEAWPAICRRLRDQACQGRAVRRVGRRAGATPPIVPAPTALPPPRLPVAARPKLVVGGRPTPQHPWKRRPLHLQTHDPDRRAKL